jgi:hypothetical protein
MDVRFWRQSSRLPLKYIRHLGGQSKHIERTWGCTRNAPRCGRFGSHGRRNPAQSPARTLSGRGNDMLASEPASWRRQEQSPEPDRAHRWRGLGTADRVAHGSDELAQMARHAPRQQHSNPRGDDHGRITRARQAAEALFTSKTPVTRPSVPETASADLPQRKPRVLRIVSPPAIRLEEGGTLPSRARNRRKAHNACRWKAALARH